MPTHRLTHTPDQHRVRAAGFGRNVIGLVAAFVLLLPAGDSLARQQSQATTRPAATQGAAGEKRAQAILTLFTGGRYEEFLAHADENLKAKLPLSDLGQLAGNLTNQIGRFTRIRKLTSAALTPETRAFDFHAQYNRGSCIVRIVLNQQDRMSAFFITSIRPETPYERPAYVNGDAFSDEKLELVCGEFKLDAVLSRPAGEGPFPAVVLLHGNGPHDLDETIGANRPFRDLAGGLASRGIAVLRYDKRTLAYATRVSPDELTLEWEALDDAVAAVELLRKRPEIDAKRIVLLGHNVGGQFAVLAARSGGNIAGIVLLAATGRSVLDQIEQQIERLKTLGGENSPATRTQIEKLQAATKDIRDGKPRANETLLGSSMMYLERLHRADALKTAAALDLPFLVIQGQRDYQVTTADFDLWKKALADRPRVTFKLFEGLNHVFMMGSGASGPSEYFLPGHVDERIIAEVAEWIAANSRK
ncbi:MAG: Esterase EstD [Phycisphaerae bacterium]|nr:Esterase EstD [Phycisphaerae bacterium]